jgi:hypothetical protein
MINGLTNSKAKVITMEPAAAKKQRKFLKKRIAKLGNEYRILKEIMRST